MSRRRPASRWLPPAAAPATVAETLARALTPSPEQAGKQAVPVVVCQLLAARGVHSVDGAKRFLRPTLDQVESPERMIDLPRAADRLAQAVVRGEPILVHGDYDVDGICSTTLMTKVLRGLGGVVTPFIPDRIADGYDLGPAGVAAAQRVGATVVLTCDCGTSAHAAATALRALGIDLIITDHHLPSGALPEAFAVVNPKRVDCPSADKDLAAVGVAYKLARAVVARCGGDPAAVEGLLDLVALATIADVAPLRGENRVFARLGLAQLAASAHPGIRSLLRAARLDGKPLTAGRVGFTLAPRLNALGRLGQAIRGVELLLAEDEATANVIARECEELNAERQELNRRMLEEALREVETLDLDATWGIVLAREGWHPGVIGIVASRLVEATARPVMMVAVQDGVGKGSGRSIPALDLHGVLADCRDLVVRFGGHRAAAGLTIEAARLPAFAERFDAQVRSRLTTDDLVPTLRTDLELAIDAVDETLERGLRHLEPFGVGNPGPIFVSRGVRIARGPRRIGTDGVKLALETPTGPLEGICWEGARAEGIAVGATVDIAYKLEANEYQGRRTLQAVIQDLRHG
ncbi:MAG: single-stranded-DNA-specific exonuclease [Gemmatimonadota bacterium]